MLFHNFIFYQNYIFIDNISWSFFNICINLAKYSATIPREKNISEDTKISVIIKN